MVAALTITVPRSRPLLPNSDARKCSPCRALGCEVVSAGRAPAQQHVIGEIVAVIMCAFARGVIGRPDADDVELRNDDCSDIQHVPSTHGPWAKLGSVAARPGTPR